MAVFDDGGGPALYVGGSFSEAGGLPAHGVARWDGAAWSALGGFGSDGVDGEVFGLAVFDDGSGPALFVGGNFDSAGGLSAQNLAAWDGEAWRVVGGAAFQDPQNYAYVRGLHVWDDGSGPALYVIGRFSEVGGVAAEKIARWDGGSWTALDGPLAQGLGWYGPVSLLGLAEGPSRALFVGGLLGSAGGLASSGVARWRCREAGIFEDGFESGDASGWTHETESSSCVGVAGAQESPWLQKWHAGVSPPVRESSLTGSTLAGAPSCECIA
ncbi:MAG: hypothetical protein M5U13_13445 [Thermoanaerobaculia bacterium]|nr:hypothetical protein [Thermoanaerobaculia bacterium]